jgi:hypothetical protein
MSDEEKPSKTTFATQVEFAIHEHHKGDDSQSVRPSTPSRLVITRERPLTTTTQLSDS